MKKFQRNSRLTASKRVESKCWGILKKQAGEFCRETGLHGYKYIGQSQRSKPERILWAITVFTSLCCAIVLMKFVWEYYATHPTLTLIESTHHGIWNYPFPAVTICDVNRISLSLTKQLVQKLKIPSNMSKEYVVQEMQLLTTLLDPGIFEYDVTPNLTQLQDIIDYNGLTIEEVINMTIKDCTSMLQICKWSGNIFDCNELFQRSKSRDGMCCSFNYVTPEKVAMLGKVEPKRLTSCGHQTGLSVLIYLDPGDYHASLLGSIGVKVMLHDPYNYPDYNAQNKLVALETETFLTIDPEKAYSTSDVRDLAISTRNCIFYDEADRIGFGNVKNRNFTFVRYSYLNCMAECRATTINANCGCIPYYIPQNGTRVCNLKDVPCLAKYRFWYDTSWPGMHINRTSLPARTSQITRRPCGCIPDCNLYRYFIESSEGMLDLNVYYRDLSFTKNPDRGTSLENHTMVHVFFGDLVSTQFRRNVHYNWRNLFASFGGLLGLFAGFSLMSIFELVYFFIIRVIVDICTKRKIKDIL
ncbi:hypothetical protein KM043_013468 [Ampulex compressa]|nr:hypothetical protein KM043_013468 [Ampulex compressa]